MGFNNYKIKVGLRILLITLFITIDVVLWQDQTNIIAAIVIFAGLCGLVYELYYFTSQTNRKLASFLESIKYADFITRFSAGNKMGSGFKELNLAFNEVMEAFRKARSEKEEHHQYLHTVVEHVSAGLLSFDQEGNVGLINATAKKLLNIGPLRNMDDLIETNSRLYKAMFDLPPGKSTLHRTSDDIQLSIHATEIKLGVNKFKLVAIQNIQPELQKKELEAWQNLTRVLRHEIMNSITPIASLTSTMKDILKEEVHMDKHICTLDIEAMDDLKEGIDTIEGRSTGLIKFIDAYRDYTSIPLPRFKEIKARELMKHVVKLMKTELKKEDIQCTVMIDPEELTITADEEQMEQVLINIMKNAIEALKGRSGAYIVLSGGKNKEEGPWLQVTDNGPGIIREALQKIFIPFYSTKNRGSGIGLALSRQIMQLHHGTLTVESEPDDYTKFTLRF